MSMKWRRKAKRPELPGPHMENRQAAKTPPAPEPPLQRPRIEDVMIVKRAKGDER